MAKFAVFGVDSVGIAHSERAARTNRDSPDVDPSLLVFWHFGPHHVAGLKAANGLGAHTIAARETVCRKIGAASLV
jgi:hypothetical protein